MKLGDLFEDTWASVPHHEGDTTVMDIDDILAKLIGPDKMLMKDIEVGDARYLENLANSLRQTGIKQPLWFQPRGDKIHVSDGIHRLIAARMAGITEIPMIPEPQ